RHSTGNCFRGEFFCQHRMANAAAKIFLPRHIPVSGLAELWPAQLTPLRACGHLHRMKNLLTDIEGVSVGHADDAALASGVTAIRFDKPAVASVDVRGGGPGTREDALLDPVSTVDAIDAITLAGGSAFGLDAGGGVQAWLAERGRGFRIRDAVIPI